MLILYFGFWPITTVLISIVWITLVWTIGYSLPWLLFPSDIPSSMWCLLWGFAETLPYFLTLQYYSLILYISCPSPRIRYYPNKQRICIFKSIWSIIVKMRSRSHSVLIYNHYSNRNENAHLPPTLANVGQFQWLWGWDGVCFFSLH